MRLSTLARRLLAAAALTGIPLGSVAAQAVVDPDLAASVASGGQAETIVTFKGSTPPGALQLDVLRGVGITGGYVFERLPVVATLATRAQVEALARDPRVRSLYVNKPLTFYNYGATHATGARRVRADEGMRSMNGGRFVTGRGVTVLVIDSGIDGTHPDLVFGENLVQNAFSPVGRYQDDFQVNLGFKPVPHVENVANTDLASGHGTHVAGTVAGTGAASGGTHAGVATEANLVGYGSGAVIALMDALGGLDYALAKRDRYNIRVVTNSWGVQRGFSVDDPIVVASRLLHDAGVTVLFAAGNSGPGPDTQNPYARAPWVISVAAGNKDGTLASFSSRGTPGGARTATSSTGEVITWYDRPTVTAPGVDITSTSATTDVLGEKVDARHSLMSGTSMATPHVAGIVALMLDANPLLTPDEVKQILMETATRMPEAMPGADNRYFEVGSGFVNAYAAVQKALQLGTPFGATLQVEGVLGRALATPISDRTFDYSPAVLPGTYLHSFQVTPGTDRIEVAVSFDGVPVQGRNLGNPILLDVHDPDGNRYYAFDTYFAVYGTIRLAVPVNNPTPGTWTAEVKSLTPLGNDVGNFATLPDRVRETITAYTFDAPALADIASHERRAAIEWALTNGFMQLCGAESFCPDQPVSRIDLARGITQAGAIRQFLPLGGGSTFPDVSAAERPFVEAVVARGAAFRDAEFRYDGVMEGQAGRFNPAGSVSRAALARVLVRSVGGEGAAQAHTGDVTILYDGQVYPLADQHLIPAGLRGAVHVAINSNILNVHWRVEQGPYDPAPVLRPYFYPDGNASTPVTRAEAATAISRYFPQFYGR